MSDPLDEIFDRATKFHRPGSLDASQVRGEEDVWILHSTDIEYYAGGTAYRMHRTELKLCRDNIRKNDLLVLETFARDFPKETEAASGMIVYGYIWFPSKRKFERIFPAKYLLARGRYSIV